MTPMRELAADAVYAVSDLISAEDWLAFECLSDVEKVQWRYCHADCDDFALTLAKITNWPRVAINCPEHGPTHRLVEAPDGRLLDVMGWVSLADLKKRYRLGKLSISRGDCIAQSLIDCDEEFLPILATIQQFKAAPFNDAQFQAQVTRFAEKLVID